MELILVILLVCLVCGGLPLVMGAYARGDLEIPKWLVNVLAFGGIALIAILRFPLDPKYGNPATYFVGFAVYIFVGQFLRKEYTRRRRLGCMLLVFLANCSGILIKCLVIRYGTVFYKFPFGLPEVGVFLVVVQAIVCLAFFMTADKEVKKMKRKKK